MNHSIASLEALLEQQRKDFISAYMETAIAAREVSGISETAAAKLKDLEESDANTAWEISRRSNTLAMYIDNYRRARHKTPGIISRLKSAIKPINMKKYMSGGTPTYPSKPTDAKKIYPEVSPKTCKSLFFIILIFLILFIFPIVNIAPVTDAIKQMTDKVRSAVL